MIFYGTLYQVWPRINIFNQVYTFFHNLNLAKIIIQQQKYRKYDKPQTNYNGWKFLRTKIILGQTTEISFFI